MNGYYFIGYRTSGNNVRDCSNGQYVSELAEQPKCCSNSARLLIPVTDYLVS